MLVLVLKYLLLCCTSTKYLLLCRRAWISCGIEGSGNGSTALADWTPYSDPAPARPSCANEGANVTCFTCAKVQLYWYKSTNTDAAVYAATIATTIICTTRILRKVQVRASFVP